MRQLGRRTLRRRRQHEAALYARAEDLYACCRDARESPFDPDRKRRLRDGRRVEKRFAIRMYMAWDIVAMLERCGFRVDSMFGSVAGEPYDRLSKRLIVAATRPA